MSEQIQFTFALSGNQSDLFNVLKFSGDEGISRLYEFNIELLSDNADVDIDAILQQPATLTLEQNDDVRVIQGIVSHFDAIRQMNNQVLYKARLVPRLWELSLYHTNEVYLDMTVPEIIEAVLTEGGFETVDYDLTSLQGEYKKWAYKCQYGETHLDFIHRLMERDGIYYYFTQGDVGEKIIFCDLVTMQDALATPEVQYSPASSLEINTLANTVHSFVSQQKRLPYRVMLKDYNDDKPSVDVKGEAIIDDGANKSSEIYVWGQNIETPEEGEQLAQIRAEQIRAGKCVYHGESAVHRLIPGYFFSLKGHFRSACNQDYCLLSLHHEGQDRRLVDGASNGQSPSYHNELMAQPADVQYRPALETPRPEIHGVLNAYVDAESDGHYAEVDEEGRYRILLPFDRVDRDGGKASHWIRMSQPFAGENQGMHFPLRKGTEVLLTFVGGDPDRPVIAGSMPNSGAPSVINADNHTNSLIQTKAGNRIELEDKDGKNRIKFETPQMGSYMHLGAPNHDGDGWVVSTNGIERKYIGGGSQVTLKTGKSNSDTSVEFGHDKDTTDPTGIFAFPKRDDKGKALNGSISRYTHAEEIEGGHIIYRRKGMRLFWSDGVEFNYGEGKIYDFGNSHEVTHWDEKDIDGAKKLVDTMFGRTVSGFKQYTADGNNPSGSWKQMIEQGEFEVKQTDTFTAQNGNIYDFGGYWNYNLGNSYEENHIDQGAAINAKKGKDKAAKGGPSFGSAVGAQVTINADSAWVTKNYGDTYEYTDGNILEIMEGNTESHVHGDVYEEFHGDAISHVRGCSHATFHGATHDLYLGAAQEESIGAYSEINVGVCSELTIGADSSIKLAAVNDMCVSVTSEMYFGLKFELTGGSKFTIDTATEMNTKVVDVEATLNNLVNSVNTLGVAANEISNGAVAIENCGISMEGGGLKMIS